VLGACVATQRIAYLNTNALQQLHAYFVGTLPRPYDRSVVSNTFQIAQGILEKTLEFAQGQWLLSSYIATGIENVPIFIRADNAENELEKFLGRTIKQQDRWATHKVVSEVVNALARGGFQAIGEASANEIISLLVPEISKPEVVERRAVSLHDEIKAKLLEIGRLQRLIVDSEYDMDGGKLDVVWRRIERAVPAYVFEVQIGGDLYHALGKLKHAFDLWNSNIFLVVAEEDVRKAMQLLAGTFHEIRGQVKLVEVEKVKELFRRKKEYHDFEAELGIL